MAEKAMTQVYYSQAHTSTAHRYGRKDWDEAKNRATYGSQYSKDGLGHNFDVRLGLLGDTTLAGASRMAKLIDHKFLDNDVDFFKNTPSTLEMITTFLYEKACEEWGDAVVSLEVREGANLACRIEKGELSLRQRARARSMDRVYDVDFTFSGTADTQSGLLMVRSDLSSRINRILTVRAIDKTLVPENWQQLCDVFSPHRLDLICLRDALDNKMIRELRR